MMGKLLAVLCVSLMACQPSNGPKPEPQRAVSIERVEVRGNCSATLEIDVQAGFVSLPIVAVISASQAGADTVGGASVDVGGLVTARCDLGAKTCAQGGLLLRGAPDSDTSGVD